MRLATFISTLALATTATAALAQTATPANAAAPAAADGHYSTSTTELGVLLDDPAAKAILFKHIPDLAKSDQIDMARGMTLKDIQPYTADAMTDKTLADVDAEFAKLPAKK